MTLKEKIRERLKQQKGNKLYEIEILCLVRDWLQQKPKCNIANCDYPCPYRKMLLEDLLNDSK